MRRPRNLVLSAGPAEHPAVALVRTAELEALASDLQPALQQLSSRRKTIVFFLPWKPPPVFAFRVDPRVESFGVSPDLWSELASWGEDLLTGRYVVFEAISHLLLLHEGLRLSVIQCGRSRSDIATEFGTSADWVIPHRGPRSCLWQCLTSVIATKGAGIVRVGIDEVPAPDLDEWFVRNPEVKSYYAANPGQGPYVLRNELVEASSDVVLFQDSDDFPTEDRQAVLCAALASDARLGMVGSHELRIDELEAAIYPVRYPLDVSRSLASGPYYCLLHPASAIRRKAFLASGGFSTIERHSMDLQFLWRSQFHFPSANVDHFAYVRRRRAGSLTTDPATKKGSYARTRYQTKWSEDFRRVSRGELRLEESSLRVWNRTEALSSRSSQRPDGDVA